MKKQLFAVLLTVLPAAGFAAQAPIEFNAEAIAWTWLEEEALEAEFRVEAVEVSKETLAFGTAEYNELGW